MRARMAEVAGTDQQIAGETAQLLHGVDHRLYNLPKAKQDHLRPVYFGAPHVTTIPPELVQHVPVIDAGQTASMAANFASVAGYNLHYGIRKIVQYAQPRGRKPFTKGFTAAVLGANILTHADEDDALPLLGPDYPFMAASTDSEAIMETWHKAKRDFGGATWNDASEQMSRLAQKVSFKAQAAQLDSVIRRLLA